MSRLKKKSNKAIEMIISKLGKHQIDKSPILKEFVKRGFEQKLNELYKEFQRGESSIEYVAEQLGITSWEVIHLLEERGLRTSSL